MVCFQFVKDDELAEDMTSEVFMRAWRWREGFKGESSLGTWLHRIAVNTCLMWKRANKRTVLSLDALEEQYTEEGSADFMEAITCWDGELTSFPARQTVNEALNRLDAESRLVVVLAEIEGYSMDEIAEVFGTSVAAVKSILSRSREELRRVLGAPVRAVSGLDTLDDVLAGLEKYA